MLNEMVKPVSQKDYENFIGIEYPHEWLFKQRSTGRTVAGCVKGGKFFVLSNYTNCFNNSELMEMKDIIEEFEN